MKRCISLLLVLCLCAVWIPWNTLTIEADAASNIVMNGIDIEYADQSYFTKNGKSCKNDYWLSYIDDDGKCTARCHKHDVCEKTTHSQCNCMRYWPTGNSSNYQVDLDSSQCMAFARYCQWKVYGSYATSPSSSGYSDLTGSISKGNCTENTLKAMLHGCSPATHIRLRGYHSISVISTSNSGISFADCNSDGLCKVVVHDMTWAGFATYIQGYNGILYAYSRNGVSSTIISASLSVDRKYYNPNDGVVFTFGGNNSGIYTLGIYKDNVRIDTVTVEGNTYIAKFPEAGSYSAYMTAYGFHDGFADSNWVYWDIKPLSVNLSVNASQFEKGDAVTLEIGGYNSTTNTGGPTTLGIFRDGALIDTVTLYDKVYTRTFSEPGQYSAYVTAYSETDYTDSNWVYWKVREYPGAPVLFSPDHLYDVNNDITFCWQTCQDADYYDFWVYQNGEAVHSAFYIEDIQHAFRLPEGSYTAKVASVNKTYGTWTWSDEYQFTVGNKYPERPQLSVSNSYVDAFEDVDFSWNDCINTDDYDFYIYDENRNTILTDFYYKGLSKSVSLSPGKFTAIIASVNRTHGTWLWSNEVSFTVTKHEHIFSYKVTQAPTTSAAGTITGTCSKCSGITSVTLPKMNSTDYTYKVTKAANCTTDGTGRYTWKTTTYGNFCFDENVPATGHQDTNQDGKCDFCGLSMQLGDQDLDGDVDSDDLTLLARHVGGIEPIIGQAFTNADVNGDGKVDSDDLTMHARYVGGIITAWNQTN